MGILKGVTAGGHLGWATKRCVVCNRKMVVGKDVVYVCPKCGKGTKIYVCAGDYKALQGKCPYCGTPLTPVV
ncbi:MAG: hypothetical protein B7O98_02525 [Zestosphaera tikiterensis]|uniref:RNA-binding protein n=1 Tax=Zestosphaera tikiterensis TaxID=1973259 RepID=A0A2R7Y718_9CREN|nr:MAG: hypothetical protein B7O98_02525 [Zestosphaera tikiterensis]